jgi:hypothetical protein
MSTLNTDYTVTGEGEDTGGEISFVVPMTGGEIVTIYRDIAIARDTDFQQNGPFRAAAINDEFDKAFLIMQELESKIGRSLRLPLTATASDAQMELSPLAAWLGRYVTIGLTGLPEPGVISDETMTPSTIGSLIYPITNAEVLAGITPNTAYPFGHVKRYGAAGGGNNDTGAFTIARSITGGRYHLGDNDEYLVDASPDIWADSFTAGANVSVEISSVTHDVSNAFAGRLRWLAASNELTWLVDARTGDYVIGIQNNVSGRATYFNRGLSITSNSHAMQMIPTAATDSIDVLLQRSAAHVADPSGNRFSFTYEGATDRWLFSFATTASGAPNFDTFMEIGAGTSPYLTFPGLRPQFNQGASFKQRASGGLHLEWYPGLDPTFHVLRDVDTPANICMTWGSGTVGFHGASPTGRLEVTGSRGGIAALASLLTQLASKGLITDSTSA